MPQQSQAPSRLHIAVKLLHCLHLKLFPLWTAFFSLALFFDAFTYRPVSWEIRDLWEDECCRRCCFRSERHVSGTNDALPSLSYFLLICIFTVIYLGETLGAYIQSQISMFKQILPMIDVCLIHTMLHLLHGEGRGLW